MISSTQRPPRSARRSLAVLVAVAAACLAVGSPAMAGDPATSIKINEIESSGLADFIELANTSGTATDVSGLVLKDDDDASRLAIRAGTSIPPGGFLAVDTDVPGGFDMSAADSARVFRPDGVTQIDGHGWASHSAVTYGRCPDGTGNFKTTEAVTKGAANDCLPRAGGEPWPGGAAVTLVDEAGVLGSDVSGLAYEGSGTATPGVMWVVDNSNGLMLRMVWDGAKWVRDTAGGWAAGKRLHFPGGGGAPDAEGVTLTDAGSAGGVYVSSERNLAASATRRPSVLRYDVSAAGGELSATHEWDLTADLPPFAANSGAESVEWVPDSHLVAAGFFDEATNAPYSPARYPNHGTGIFFVGLEGNGSVYAYALDHTSGEYTRVATFASGFPTFAALSWDAQTDRLWVVCDDNCEGRSRLFAVDRKAGATRGRFVPVAHHARPADMPNTNNEGFAITPAGECVGGTKPVFWADDDNAGGRVLRAGTLDCRTPPPTGAGWSAGTAQAKGDFDGDGFGDLAVGVRENMGSGAVHIFRGGASGVSVTSTQLWSQSSPGIADTSEAGDDFGRALATGDYNGDGRPDLAIGAPGENTGRGAVHVLYGGAGGLTAIDSRQLTQNSSGVGDVSEAGDRFGETLAAGKLDDAPHAELAVAAPGEDGTTTADGGVVHVLRGGPAGPDGAGSQTWSQASAGVADTPETGDRFGSSLAIGDLGGTTHDDLAIGVPLEDGTSTTDQGVVHVLPGSSTGPTATGSSMWSQNSTGVADTAESGDSFGGALAAGDLGGTPLEELAIGVPGEDSGTVVDAGIVQTLAGAVPGPTGSGSQTVGQATVGIADTPEAHDAFGFAVAVADLGGSPFLDLAVGVPGEGSSTIRQHGLVHVIPGSEAGLTATGSGHWTQNSTGIGDNAEAGDRFGEALSAADYGRSAHDDLAIGVPSEDRDPIGDTGIVQVVPGSDGFLDGPGSKTFSQGVSGVPDTGEAGDRMGLALGR